MDRRPKAQATAFHLKRKRENRLIVAAATGLVVAVMAGSHVVPKYWSSIEPVLTSALSFIF